MKWSLATLFITAIFSVTFISSCTKKNYKEDEEPVASFKFRMNGIHVDWFSYASSCFGCRPRITDYGTHYILYAHAPENYVESIKLQINTTALNVGTYNDTVTTQVDYLQAKHRFFSRSVRAVATEVGDFASITITSIRDGKYYDGTFTARLTDTAYGTGVLKLTIEQGKFYNVKGN